MCTCSSGWPFSTGGSGDRSRTSAQQARLGAARDSLASGEQAYRVARLRYEGGLTSYLTLLSAEDAVIIQRRVVAQLEARALTLDASLVRALGGGFRA